MLKLLNLFGNHPITTSSLIILKQLLDFFKPPSPAGRGECKEKGGKRSEKREHRKKKIKRKVRETMFCYR